MAAIKSGDRVKIITRPVGAEDAKSGLYYEYFGGLMGKADRVYDDNSVCVDVDIECLRPETRDRHLAMQENERKRWLESLSDEGRNKLTADQKQLKISYKILVSKTDLEICPGGAPRPATKSDKAAGDAPDAHRGEPRAPGPSASAPRQTPKREPLTGLAPPTSKPPKRHTGARGTPGANPQSSHQFAFAAMLV